MCRARAHYVHVGCTSGHPLWQCSEQPIIYSTLISTHVNPHQSSPAQGDCCGSHAASWQDTQCEQEETLLGLIWTCHHTRQVPPDRAATSSPFQNWSGGPEEKGQQAESWLAAILDPFLVLGTHLKRGASRSRTAQWLPQAVRPELQAGFTPENAECRSAGQRERGWPSVPPRQDAVPHRPTVSVMTICEKPMCVMTYLF